MIQISILGCGWLGFPLAESLIKKGFSVNGSTTSLDKISVLRSSGIMSFQITLNENKIEGEIEDFLENSEVLIIDIPPKLRGDTKDTSTALSKTFVEKIKNLIPFIEKSSVKKVIFVSSTSVYSDDLNFKIFTEKDQPQPETESGKQLLEVETILLENTNFDSLILRFGGLIGENRNPIKFLSGRKDIENPDAPINLIHQKDCIGIIEKIILEIQNLETKWNEIYNAAYPFHPTRKNYYCQKALEQNLPLPEFDSSKPSIGKVILSKKIETILGYKFLEKI